MDKHPVGPPPFTAADALAEGMGALGGWIDGYTTPHHGSEHPQRRVKSLTGGDDAEGTLIIKVEGARYTDEPDRFFRYVLTVAEIPGPARAKDGSR